MSTSSAPLDQLEIQSPTAEASASLDDLEPVAAAASTARPDFTQDAVAGKLAAPAGAPAKELPSTPETAAVPVPRGRGDMYHAKPDFFPPTDIPIQGVKDIYQGYEGFDGLPVPVTPMPAARGQVARPAAPRPQVSAEDQAVLDQQANQRAKSAAKMIQGVGEVGTVALPAAVVAAPAATALSLGTGYLASEGVGHAVHGKMSPESEELARQVAFFIPSVLGTAAGVKTTSLKAPGPRGTSINAFSAFGDKVAGGVRITPEDVTIGGRVGRTQISTEFSRRFKYSKEPLPPDAAETAPVSDTPNNPGQQRQLPVKGTPFTSRPPVPITGTPHVPEPSDAAKALMDFESHTGNPDYQPVPPAPAPPAPPEVAGPQHLTPDVVKGVSDAILAHPEAARPALMSEAHGNMVKWMLNRGTFVGPDGKIHAVDSEKQAQKLASQFINDEVDRVDEQKKFTAEDARERRGKAAAEEAAVKAPKRGSAVTARISGTTYTGKFQRVDENGMYEVRTEDGKAVLAAPKNVTPSIQPTLAAPVSGTPPRDKGLTTGTAAVQKTAAEANIHPEQKPAIMVKEEPAKETAALARPAAPVEPEAVAAIGKTEPESKRTILQPSGDVMQNERLAAAAAPELTTKLSHIAAGVPGARFDRVRPQKELERIGEKVDLADKPPETVPDYLAAQIAADTPQAKDQLVASLKKQFKVIGVEDAFLQGREKLAGYPSANVQVQMGNGLTAEVQIVPREVQEIANESHTFYTAGREAELRGDQAEHQRNFAEAQKLHDAAMEKFRARNGIAEPGQFKKGSTQINIDPASELAKAHARVVAAIPDEHLMPTDFGGTAKGREDHPHVTVRYGLKDDSAGAVQKIREVAAQIQPFEVPVGKTETFPASVHSDGAAPVVARLEVTPELKALRSAMEKASSFHADTFPEYKPHITLAYVKPEAARQYQGGAHLEGQKVPVREIVVSKKDGSQETIPLGGAQQHAVPLEELEHAERRSNLAQRKRVEHMTPEERGHALLTDEKTGLANYRAFKEDAGLHPQVGYADVDDFKQFNSLLGHESVDEKVLPAIGEALQRAAAKEPGGSIKVYHRSGDEFLFRTDDAERVQRVVERVNQELAAAVFTAEAPDGTLYEKKGAGLSHGTGRSEAAAEHDAEQGRHPGSKTTRKQAGVRSGARDLAGRVGQEPAAGKQVEVSHAAEAVPLEELEQAPDVKKEPFRWGRSGPGYLRTIPSHSGVGRFLSESKEVATVGLPGRYEPADQTVYYNQGKLVVLSPSGGYNNDTYVHEIKPADYGDHFRWKQRKDIAEIAQRFGAEVGQKRTAIVSDAGAMPGLLKPAREFKTTITQPPSPEPGSPEYEDLRNKLARLEHKPVESNGRALAVRQEQKTAERLRTAADGLEKQIEDKQRAMSQNPTPKRMREYRSRLHDGENLKRVQQAMRALADAHESGTVPPLLRDLRGKDEIHRLVYKSTLGGGYYDVIPDPEYANKTPQGKALQELMERHTSEPSEAKAEREKASKISQLEADVQFQKLPGYFPTPKPVVERMLARAAIRPGDKVLEPSAGKGNIADLIREREPEAELSTIEPQSKLRQILELKGHRVADSEFLGHEGEYDKIVMNPPFENGQDIDHVQRAFTLLKPGGKVVAIMSEGPFFRNDRKAQAFREWLEEHGGSSEKLEPGAFKESGTGAAARMAVINKPKAKAAAAEIPDTKEPWQMTQGYVSLERAKPDFPLQGKVEVKNGKPVYVYSTTVRWGNSERTFAIETRGALNGAEQARRLHKKVIEGAIAEGKAVPAEALKDYPDLKPTAREPISTGKPAAATTQFDEAIKHTGAEVKEGKPSEAFAAKIKEATHLEPANDAELKEKFTGAAYQREYFKAALEQAKATWAGLGVDYEYMAKGPHNEDVKGRPPSVASDQLYIKVPGDGHFLVNNTPFAIEKALKGAARGFAAPRATFNPKVKPAKFAAPKATPEATAKYRGELADALDDAESEKRRLEQDIADDKESREQQAQLTDDLNKELKALRAKPNGEQEKVVRREYQEKLRRLPNRMTDEEIEQARDRIAQLDADIPVHQQNVADFNEAFQAHPIKGKPSESDSDIASPTRVVPGGKSAYTENETGLGELEQLTRTIEQNAQGKSLKERIRLGAKLGEEASATKDEVTALLGRLKGGVAALVDALKRPPQAGDYEKATGEWSGADQRSALDSYRFTKAIKEAVPEKLTREAISNWIEAGGDEAVLRERADQSQAPYKAGYERALKLTDAQKTIAQNVMNLHDATLQEAIAAGILEEGVENYIQHIYKDQPRLAQRIRAEMNFNTLVTKPSFSKQRKLPDYFTAEQIGLKPKDKDVGFLTSVHERSLREALAARGYIRTLMQGEAADGRPLVATSWASAKEIAGKDEPAYLIKPNLKPGEDFADYKTIDHPALRGWKWSGEIDGKNVFVQGDAVVHPEIYRRLKNNLSSSALRNYEVTIGDRAVRPGAFALDTVAEIKHFVLSFSGFHQTTLGIHALEHKVWPTHMPELKLNEPEQAALVDHGLMVAHWDAMEAFGEGLSSGGLITKTPAIGPLYRAYVDYLFRDYMPRLKMQMARTALARNRQRYPALDEDQLHFLTASQANAAFGGLNYRLLGRNKTLQDTLRLLLMAPDFTEARGRFVAQAGKPWGREQLAALALGAAVLYTVARIINQMSDGEPHWSKPFSVVSHGKEYGLRTIQGDLLDAAEDPKRFLQNRVSPPVSAIFKDDRYHRKNESLAEKLKSHGEGAAPIPLQPWLRHSDDSNAQKAVETVLKMIGVNEKKEPKHR